MTDPHSKRIAVVGATGLVGRTIARVLEERRFPVREYIPIATDASSGNEVEALGRTWPVLSADDTDFSRIDVAFFTAGASVSKEFVPRAIDAGCCVIDNTTAYRMSREVPLVVPEINGALVTPESRLVSCPNCTTIILVMTLAPLHMAVPIDRVVVTSFQPVSGAGREALAELDDQTAADVRGEAPAVNILPKQIAFNCMPVIGDVKESGYSNEEEKIVEETQKILESPEIKVVPTAVRVPTRVGHALSVNAELRSPLDVDRARKLWQDMAGVSYTDEVPTPIDVVGRNEIVVGRLRRDPTRPNAIAYWVVGDNLRKGAATNSVQIAELMALKG